MPITNPLSQHFILKSAILYSDRKTGSEALDFIDIGPLVEELKITETASRPYTIGQVLVVDQNNLFRSLQMKGSERITFELAPAQGNDVKPIKRTFMVRGLNTVVKNDTFVYDLVEEFGYSSTTKVFSRSYTDRIESILYYILDAMGRKLNTLYSEDNKKGCARSQRTHVVVPYMTPWETLTWLTDRMTGQTGTPWFLSGSLYHENTNVWSLEQSLKSTPFNVEHVFVESERYAQATGATGIEASEFADTAIKGHVERRSDSMHAMEKAQAIAGMYELVDTNNNIYNPLQYDITSTLKLMEKDGMIANQDLVDPALTIGNEKMAYVPSCNIVQMTSGNTYLLGQSYSDDPSTADSFNKVSNKMLKNAMIQKTLTAQMPGKLFAAFKVAVGHKIRMHFLSGDRVDNKKALDLDPKLSGDYVITGITHTFSNTEYNVTIDGVKFHRDPDEQKY